MHKPIDFIDLHSWSIGLYG